MQSAPSLDMDMRGSTLVSAWAQNALMMIVCFAAVMVIMWPVIPLEVDPHHDGLILKSARDVAFGAIPFRESFTQYGLLLSLMHGATLNAFGMSLKVLRIETVVLYAAAGSALWLLWSQFIGRRYALFSVLIWIALGPFFMFPLLPWSSATALVFQATSILLVCRYWYRRSLWMLFASAFAAGVVFWIRMPVGVLLVGALGFVFLFSAVVQRYLFKPRFWLEFGVLAAGLLAILIPFLAYLIAVDALSDWFTQTFLLAFVFAKTIPVAWNGGDGGQLRTIITSFFPANINLIWAAYPLAALLSFGYVCWQFYRSSASRLDASRWALLTLATTCLASWAQYYPVTEERHVFWASTPMVGLFVYVVLCTSKFVSEHAEPLSRRARLRVPRMTVPALTLVAVGLLAIPPMAQRWMTMTTRLTEFTSVIDRPAVLRGLLTNASTRDILRAMDDDIGRLQQEFPNRPIITTGYDPLPLTFGKYQPNWHPLFVYYDIGVAIYPKFPAELGAYLKAVHPIVVTSGYDLLDAGYKVVGHYANGLTIMAPGATNASTLLPPSVQDDGSTVLHFEVANRFSLRTPMRVTGHRTQAVPFDRFGSIEFVVRPQMVEGINAHLLGNLFGPEPFKGFAIRRATTDGDYELTVGVNGSTAVPAFRFRTTALQCNHVVVRRRDSLWDVWVNGRKQAQEIVANSTTMSPNQLIVNNGMSLSEYHVGLLDELRILTRALTDETIVSDAAYALGRCKNSALMNNP